MNAHPERIGKFRIEGLLGRGAMGVVYRAHDPDIDRTVAIKLIRTDLLSGEDREHYVTRFRTEAKMVGRCIHPKIVGIHDFSMHEGSPFLVLEFVDGTDLGRLLRREVRLPADMAARLTLGVLEALDYAHAFGVVHRDIKPGNILLTAADEVKVTDFGIARALSSSVTMSSVLVGTPCYMSPEQCLGNAVDARSDVFSVGCVAYEMLAGALAFAGPNYVATTHRILHEAPRPLLEHRASLPPALVAVVDRAMAKRADERYQTAGEMAAALRAASVMLAEDAPDPTVVMRRAAKPGGATGASLPGLAAGQARPGGTLDIPPASLATVERELAHHVGPIARLHLQRAVRTAQTPDELVQTLAALIPAGPERDRLSGAFAGILAPKAGVPVNSTGTGLAAHEIQPARIDTVGKALTQVIGPIGPRMLQQALASARTPEELEAACLALIGSDSGRDQFRKLLMAAPRR